MVAEDIGKAGRGKNRGYHGHVSAATRSDVAIHIVRPHSAGPGASTESSTTAPMRGGLLHKGHSGRFSTAIHEKDEDDDYSAVDDDRITPRPPYTKATRNASTVLASGPLRNISTSLEQPNELVRPQPIAYLSVTGANLNLDWLALKHVEFYVDGGNNWLYSAELNGRQVVVKTVKPRFRDDPVAIEDLERELKVHARLSHPNIVDLIGAGLKPLGERFIVLEKLEGGSLSEMLGFHKKIERKSSFSNILIKNEKDIEPLSYIDVLKHARSLSFALQYCHTMVPGCMILHRDLKPENIAFTSDGLLKIIDFGLAKEVSEASPLSEDVYQMSGKTGSYRYMSPEVALTEPYNHKADVYSFSLILWTIMAGKKPFEGLGLSSLHAKVWRGGMRPSLKKGWPEEFNNFLQECWSPNMQERPNFDKILETIDLFIVEEMKQYLF